MLLVGCLVYRQAQLLVAICNTRLLFHITRACCFFACNDSGQRNLSPITHAKMATTPAAFTRHLPKCIPRPCLCTTNTIKDWHVLQTHDTRHTRHEYKAHTKALASSMPMHNRHIETLERSTNSWHMKHGLSTRRVPRSVPRPCPYKTDFNKIRYITEKLSAFTHATRGGLGHGFFLGLFSWAFYEAVFGFLFFYFFHFSLWTLGHFWTLNMTLSYCTWAPTSPKGDTGLMVLYVLGWWGPICKEFNNAWNKGHDTRGVH